MPNTHTHAHRFLACVIWPCPGVRSLLDIEIQMAWEFKFSGQDLLIDSKWIVIKEWWVPVERNKRHLWPAPLKLHTHCHSVQTQFVLCKSSMMQGTGKVGKSLHTLTWITLNKMMSEHVERSLFREGGAMITFCCRQSSLCSQLFWHFCVCVSISTNHRPSAATLHWMLSQLSCSSLCSGQVITHKLHKGTGLWTHYADRRIIAPVCHTPLPSEKLQSQENVGWWVPGSWLCTTDSTHMFFVSKLVGSQADDMIWQFSELNRWFYSWQCNTWQIHYTNSRGLNGLKWKPFASEWFPLNVLLYG